MAWNTSISPPPGPAAGFVNAFIPLLVNISVAILSTKIPILLGHDFLGFHVAKLSRYGLWGMLSEARTDFSMFLGLSFLLIVGAGPWSVDHFRRDRPKTGRLIPPGQSMR